MLLSFKCGLVKIFCVIGGYFCKGFNSQPVTEFSVIIKGVIIELSDNHSLAKKSALFVGKKWLLCVEKVTPDVDNYEIHIKSERFCVRWMFYSNSSSSSTYSSSSSVSAKRWA